MDIAPQLIVRLAGPGGSGQRNECAGSRRPAIGVWFGGAQNRWELRHCDAIVRVPDIDGKRRVG
jgi:hypothetical protein